MNLELNYYEAGNLLAFFYCVRKLTGHHIPYHTVLTVSNDILKCSHYLDEYEYNINTGDWFGEIPGRIVQLMRDNHIQELYSNNKYMFFFSNEESEFVGWSKENGFKYRAPLMVKTPEGEVKNYYE